MQLVKKLEPEEIAYKLQQFDPGMCTQVFLSELKRVLPSPEEVSVFSRCKYFILRAEP
jgi:cytokinesis protein